MNHKGRVRTVQAALEKSGLDALITVHLANVRYLCGFTGSAAVLIVNDKGAILFTDGRYTQQASEEVRGAKVRIEKGKSALAAAGEWLRGDARSRKRIGIEPSHLTVADKAALARGLRSGTKLIDALPIVERMRMIKEPEEIARIRKACHLGAKLFDGLLKSLRAGVPESEVAGELEFAARKRGAEQMSFPTIIAGGTRSALPHGRASSARLPRRGFVVCDFGVILAGYCSDMTRTVHLGRASVQARVVYEAVRDAQQAALETVKPGRSVGDVDKAARNLLYNRRLSKYFSHSTGHGLGLEIHEIPRVAAGQDEELKPGMVITVEPGVYLPGKFGVRIEDTVVVNETGHEILTPCSKDLISV